eukprot:jgi/Botrbrau1/1086/Bobra.0076s0050.1
MWRREEMQMPDAHVACGVRVDVPQPPSWMPELVEAPLVEGGVLQRGFVNMWALNVYQDGSEGIQMHFDDPQRFCRPIVSLRLFSDSRLSFGTKGYGYSNGEFYVDMPRGCVLVMEQGGFAAAGEKHGVRPSDMTGKSAGLIMRQMNPKVLAQAHQLQEQQANADVRGVLLALIDQIEEEMGEGQAGGKPSAGLLAFEAASQPLGMSHPSPQAAGAARRRPRQQACQLSQARARQLDRLLVALLSSASKTCASGTTREGPAPPTGPQGLPRELPLAPQQGPVGGTRPEVPGELLAASPALKGKVKYISLVGEPPGTSRGLLRDVPEASAAFGMDYPRTPQGLPGQLPEAGHAPVPGIENPGCLAEGVFDGRRAQQGAGDHGSDRVSHVCLMGPGIPSRGPGPWGPDPGVPREGPAGSGGGDLDCAEGLVEQLRELQEWVRGRVRRPVPQQGPRAFPGSSVAAQGPQGSLACSGNPPTSEETASCLGSATTSLQPESRCNDDRMAAIANQVLLLLSRSCEGPVPRGTGHDGPADTPQFQPPGASLLEGLRTAPLAEDSEKEEHPRPDSAGCGCDKFKGSTGDKHASSAAVHHGRFASSTSSTHPAAAGNHRPFLRAEADAEELEQPTARTADVLPPACTAAVLPPGCTGAVLPSGCTVAAAPKGNSKGGCDRDVRSQRLTLPALAAQLRQAFERGQELSASGAEKPLSHGTHVVGVSHSAGTLQDPRQPPLKRAPKEPFANEVCEVCLCPVTGAAVTGESSAWKCSGLCRKVFHACCRMPGISRDNGDMICEICHYNRHKCFACKADGAGGLVRCNGRCGRAYHVACSQSFRRGQAQGPAGAAFWCPLHYCAVCGLSGDGIPMLQCCICPTAFHVRCHPAGVTKITKKYILCSRHG